MLCDGDAPLRLVRWELIDLSAPIASEARGHSGGKRLHRCRFSLPLRSDRILPQPEVEVKHLPKVFVVDDDLAILTSIEAVLVGQGYSVKCFESAEEFLAQHHPTEVGCVLVDLLMPGMGGGEMLRQLQESGSLLSVVIISGLIESVPTEEFESPSVLLLEKPYEVSTLLKMVEDGFAGSVCRRAKKLRGGSLN